MIGSLNGTIKGIIRDTIILEVGGVGYGVYCPTATLARVSDGDPLSLWTYLAVRENAQDLFGFETRDELQWFELLLTVSGIGPRSALAILNSADIATLESAIAHNDPGVLAGAFGVGKKTSEKIVLELREKVEIKNTDSAGKEIGGDGDVFEALVALGYSAKEARDTTRALPKDIEGTEARLREALRIASRTK